RVHQSGARAVVHGTRGGVSTFPFPGGVPVCERLRFHRAFRGSLVDARHTRGAVALPAARATNHRRALRGADEGRRGDSPAGGPSPEWTPRTPRRYTGNGPRMDDAPRRAARRLSRPRAALAR